MPLNVRSIAVSIAVICFLGLSLVGWVSGLSPFTCCKRSLTAAVCAYVIAVCAVKAINAILMNAMMKSQVNQQKEKADASED